LSSPPSISYPPPSCLTSAPISSCDSLTYFTIIPFAAFFFFPPFGVPLPGILYAFELKFSDLGDFDFDFDFELFFFLLGVEISSLDSLAEVPAFDLDAPYFAGLAL